MTKFPIHSLQRRDRSQISEDTHAEWLDWYKRILAVRKEKIVPLIGSVGAFAGSYQVLGNGAVMVCWTLEGGKALVLAENLSDISVDNFKTLEGDLMWHEGPQPTGSIMRPWSVRWFITSGEHHEIV